MTETLSYDQHFAVPFSHEQRSYSTLKLPNGISGIIITDPSEDVASCSLSVATGHHANPDTIPGLAHLCEHMISVSSKDYPQPDTLTKSIHDAGGSKNAFTTNESSTYYFSVPISSNKQARSDFEHILEIFTSNFDCPLFDETYSNREIYAVDNEHTVNKSKKNRLAFQGFKLLANKKHQFSRFSTGSLTSLTESCKKYDIRAKLVQFFEKEYTPDRMCFVIRGPQSMNYLQKLALINFGKIRASRAEKELLDRSNASNTTLTREILISNISSHVWKSRYETDVFGKDHMKKAVLIDKDVDSVLRIAFPVKLAHDKISRREYLFYQDYWCDLFGSETANTIASVLLSRELIVSLTTKISDVTFNTILLELELNLTNLGMQSISTIIDITLRYASLFDSNDKKFTKHLAKSMSQFNGIQMYNFLHAEVESNSIWETKTLSCQLLSDFSSYGKYFLKQMPILDFDIDGYHGSYTDDKIAQDWWMLQAASFCKFMEENVNLENMLISYVGHIKETNLDWIENSSENMLTESDFDFSYKIERIKSSIFDQSNNLLYELGLSPPNVFAKNIVESQTKLLDMIAITQTFSSTASLGYSVKNTALATVPNLHYFDEGSQLWYKHEIDATYKDKILFTMELVNTELPASPELVVTLEMLTQIVNFRVSEYLYSALTMNYAYNLYPSFKGDTGILLHVSGPKGNFEKVLTVLIYEMKLVIESFNSVVSKAEYERARKAVLFRFQNVENISSLETATLGMMALIEENTWMPELRVSALEKCSFNNIQSQLPKLFSKCYLTAFLHGDIESCYFKDVMSIIKKLSPFLDGAGHQFPSSIMLPKGTNFIAHASSKNLTNALQIFIQTCIRDDIENKSITKFVSFVMTMSLVNLLRTEYQLGYIALVGLKTFRRTHGIHISIVSGSYTASDLEKKVDDILMEWYERNVKKLKQSQLNDLIEKFISSEKSSSTGSSLTTNASLFYGAIGSNSGDSKAVKQHCGFWEQMDSKTYAFSGSIQGDDSINYDFIKKLTTSSFNAFIKAKILPTSTERCKASVLVDSSCSKEEMEKESKGIQLFLFLSSMGLPIKQQHLQDILKASGDSQILLSKNLYKYYRERGKSITLLAAMMTKLSKSLFLRDAASVEPAIKKTEVDVAKITEWQQNIGYVRNRQSISQKLNTLFNV
ncbi:hypothetical protein CANINC_000359 [Pichia inconspicua]|uniref:Peptidase M16 N-terminal domain-containing protein n=1 Tax=Pichia inconspicua TaxID=52247 RepID=A0A4T0X6X0_9ASCO|nr:hypothetical protein CANINC_000359 [[Candida] inconspicua]